MGFTLLKTNIDLPPYIKIKHSKRAKRLALRLDSQNRVFNLIIPQGINLHKVHKFAHENESWMQKRLSQLSSPIYFNNGIEIPIFGKTHLIKIDHDEKLRKTNIILNNNELLVFTNKDDPDLRIKRFLKKEMRNHVNALANEKANIIGKTINKIQIRDTKSRWGSCSVSGGLSFSWRLILAPYEALDYVVAHEVAHLEHLNHSKSFWKLCEKLSTNYNDGKIWMRKNGHELMQYR